MESTIHMIEKISKADQSLHNSAVIVVHTVIPKVDVSKNHRENHKVNHEKDHSITRSHEKKPEFTKQTNKFK